MSEENIDQTTPSEENSRTVCESTEGLDIEKSEDISVFNLETFQKQLSRLDGKKQKSPINLATSPNIAVLSCEAEIVGDDLHKNVPYIVCECEPNATGAAAPILSPLNESLSQNSIVQCLEVVDESKAVKEPQPATKLNIPEKSVTDKKECVKINKPKKGISKFCC